MAKTKCKKERYSIVHGYETKEGDELITGGYIATTHLDSGFVDHERDLRVKDQIAKETLDNWAEEINQGNPRANKVSVNHDREPHVTGVGLRGSARVDVLPDGEYGLYVDTLVDKSKSTFDDVSYRIDKGLLDSFSIEFTTAMEEAYSENTTDEGIVRTLLPGTQLEGWTLASQPMNEHAVMIKELLDRKMIKPKTNKEVIKMTEIKEEEQPKVEEVKVEEQPVVEEQKVEAEAPAEEKEKEVDPEYKEFLAMKAKSAKEAELKEIKAEVMQ